MSKKRRTPPAIEAVWRNGPTFRFGEEPPARYKTVADFKIALVSDEFVGLQMEWRSATLGLLTPVWCFTRLEDPDWRYRDDAPRLVDGWRPVGTADSGFIEMDQGFVLVTWADRRFVHVEYGWDEDETGFLISTWYRVPYNTFDAAWDDMLSRLGAIHAGSAPHADEEAGG